MKILKIKIQNRKITENLKFIVYNVQAAKSLDLSSINGIIEYLPEELYIKVKPGTLMEDVESALEKNNQELSFEPTDFGYINNGISNKGTVGGCVACNFAGSRAKFLF